MSDLPVRGHFGRSYQGEPYLTKKERVRTREINQTNVMKVTREINLINTNTDKGDGLKLK